MNEKCLLIIFIKNPVSGKVKQRLARDIGNENALKVYQYLLKRVHDAVIDLPLDKAVFYSEKITRDDSWEENHFLKFLQKGKDMGTRMSNAFEKAFELGYEKVVLIGGDIPEMSGEVIGKACCYLEIANVVLGPAEDGGYYLVGQNKNLPSLFQDIPWGTDRVYSTTIKKLQDKFIDYQSTNLLTDIDTVDELERFPEIKALIERE